MPRPQELSLWQPLLILKISHSQIAMCNRVGQESEMNFSGESIVVNQNGEAIKKAGDQEEIIYVDIDLSDSKKIRESRPYTQLRRNKFYRKIILP